MPFTWDREPYEEMDFGFDWELNGPPEDEDEEDDELEEFGYSSTDFDFDDDTDDFDDEPLEDDDEEDDGYGDEAFLPEDVDMVGFVLVVSLESWLFL